MASDKNALDYASSLAHPLAVFVEIGRCVPSLILIVITLTFLVTPAQSMTFEYRMWSSDDGSGDEPAMHLVASGPIEPGDAARFREFIAHDPQQFLVNSSMGMILDSPGGNVQEALEIAQLLRDLLVMAKVFSPAKCGSSCFLLYVGSPLRYANGYPNKPALAIHRPYFAQATAERMSPMQADKAHSELLEKTRAWLQSQFVPQRLIDKLLSLPSSDAYWLTNDDIQQIAFRAPWYEEWILARCPDLISSENDAIRAQGTPRANEAMQRFDRSSKCEAKEKSPFRREALRKLGIAVP